MRYYAYYVVRPKSKLLSDANLDDEMREILAEPVAFRNPQGGRTAWMPPDYQLLVKLFYLAELRKRYGGAFLCDAPHSASFFDHWWDLEVLPEGLDCEELADEFDKSDFHSADCGDNNLVRSYFERFPFRRGDDLETPLNRQYRIIYEKDVIGWLKDPSWERGTAIHGLWSGTTNTGGSEFSKAKKDDQEYDVILEGPSMIRGKIKITGSKAVFEFPATWL